VSERIIVTVSPELHKTIEALASLMGVSIPEYIRFLILKKKEEMEQDVFTPAFKGE
jgi:hypothetical protein